jgi:hypothetical protein
MLLGAVMGQFAKILVLYFLVFVFISAAESLEVTPIMHADAGGRASAVIHPSHRSNDDAADGLEVDTRPMATTHGTGTDIVGNAYALPSPGTNDATTLAPGSAVDYEWILTYDIGRENGDQEDVVFYGQDGGAVLEPGAIAVLGFGLMGLFVIVRRRIRK